LIVDMLLVYQQLWHMGMKKNRRIVIAQVSSAFPKGVFGHGHEFDGFWKPKPQTLFPALKAH
jgi:hypothetical protein